MRGLLSILSLCDNKLNKFNDTEAQMLEYIYDMTLKVIKLTFWREHVKILP